MDWLKDFCSKDPARYYLTEPFTQDEYTYATNGHIMVRVPKIDGVGPCKSHTPFNADGPLKGIDEIQFEPFDFKLPLDPGSKGDCPDCDGRGYEHDCPDCECECDLCHGSGEADPELRVSTTVAGRIFSLGYIRMITRLPGALIGKTKDNTPLFFKFDGGVGAVMIRSAPLKDHIEIEQR
jgi:hypothetical protein